MAFPSRDEIRSACNEAETRGFSVGPGATIGEARCCPLGAVLLARGLQGRWIEGTSDWLDLADLLEADPDEVESFTETYEGGPDAAHPLGLELRRQIAERGETCNIYLY